MPTYFRFDAPLGIYEHLCLLHPEMEGPGTVLSPFEVPYFLASVLIRRARSPTFSM